MTAADPLHALLVQYDSEDHAPGRERSWLRYSLIQAAEEEALARAHELHALAIESKPDSIRDPQKDEERAATYRKYAGACRNRAAECRRLAAEEMAKRRAS